MLYPIIISNLLLSGLRWSLRGSTVSDILPLAQLQKLQVDSISFSVNLTVARESEFHLGVDQLRTQISISRSYPSQSGLGSSRLSGGALRHGSLHGFTYISTEDTILVECP